MIEGQQFIAAVDPEFFFFVGRPALTSLHDIAVDRRNLRLAFGMQIGQDRFEVRIAKNAHATSTRGPRMMLGIGHLWTKGTSYDVVV